MSLQSSDRKQKKIPQLYSIKKDGLCAFHQWLGFRFLLFAFSHYNKYSAHSLDYKLIEKSNCISTDKCELLVLVLYIYTGIFLLFINKHPQFNLQKARHDIKTLNLEWQSDLYPIKKGMFNVKPKVPTNHCCP